MSPAPHSPAPPLYSLSAYVPRNNIPTSNGCSAWISLTETTQPHWPSLPTCSSTIPVPSYSNSAPPFSPTCTVNDSIYPGIPSTIYPSSTTSVSGVSQTTSGTSFPLSSLTSCTGSSGSTSGDSQTTSGTSFLISSPASSSCCTGSTTSASGISQTSTGPSSTISPTSIPNNNGTIHARICNGVNEDPDISGIGVRITFYLTNLLTVVGALLPRFEAEGPFWATWFTSTALLFSAAAEADKHNLSLYNAIIVSYLCYIHCVSAVWLLSIKSLCGDRTHTLRYLPFTVLQIVGFVIYCLYIWSHAKTFGNQPECNADTKFVFFFKNFSAVHQGPHIAIPILSVLFVGQFLDLGEYVYTAATPSSFDGYVTGTADAVRTVVFLYLPQWVYVVVTTELTIQRNWVIPNPPKFSFGQIFPLVTIGIPVVAILLALLPENWIWPWFRLHVREWTHFVTLLHIERIGPEIRRVFLVRSQPSDQATATQRLIEEPSVARIEEVHDADSG